MGFYSIYKIIKDVIRTLFGNKTLKIILIICIISIIAIFINKTNVFASFSISYGDKNLTITDEWIEKFPYYAFYNLNDSGSNLMGSYICSKSPLTITPFYNSSNTSIIDYYLIESTDLNGIASSFTTDLQFEINHCNDINLNDISSYTAYVYSSNAYNFVYSNYNIYTNNGDLVHSSDAFTPPTLNNSLSDLENLSFNNFSISANSYTNELENNDGTFYMLFYNRSLSNSQNTDGLYPIKEKAFTKGSIYTDYNNSTDDNMVFSFPLFMSGVYFNIGSTYEIRFATKTYNYEYNTYFYDFFDTSYTFTISSNVTQDYINQLNQQTATSSDSEREQQLQDSINQQTQSIDNINNTITDSTVDSSSIELPTDNTNDPTQSGVDNIFQTIYNSFTSGTAQDIVFPIPNTNKNITLPASYTYDSLNNNNASWVIDIIQAFYWYIIARYIIVDIMQKIRKIKQGNLDNIENSNIKEDML